MNWFCVPTGRDNPAEGAKGPADQGCWPLSHTRPGELPRRDRLCAVTDTIPKRSEQTLQLNYTELRDTRTQGYNIYYIKLILSQELYITLLELAPLTEISFFLIEKKNPQTKKIPNTSSKNWHKLKEERVNSLPLHCNVI